MRREGLQRHPIRDNQQADFSGSSRGDVDEHHGLIDVINVNIGGSSWLLHRAAIMYLLPGSQSSQIGVGVSLAIYQALIPYVKFEIEQS